MQHSPLTLGILTDDAAKQRNLSQVVTDHGYVISANILLAQAAPEVCKDLKNIDAWLVDIDMADTQAQQLSDWLEHLEVPVIFGDGDLPLPGTDEYNSWLRRFVDKLERLLGTINLQKAKEVRAEYVWVLAASTGGPQAVSEFLRLLPADLGVGFIYVQHIDANYNETLIQVMSKDSHYPAYPISHGAVVGENRVAVVSAESRVDVLDNGTLLMRKEAWSGPYSPSADQVIANVASLYGQRSGVIVFSGMGNDGASSSRLMKQQGGQVWAQTPQSCACSSMPDEAVATDSVNYVGTPVELAQKLERYMASVNV